MSNLPLILNGRPLLLGGTAHGVLLMPGAVPVVFGAGPNVLVRGSGVVTAPLEPAYDLDGNRSSITVVAHIGAPIAGNPNYMAVGHGFSFYIDASGILQFQNKTANQTYAFGPYPNGGYFQAIITDGAVGVETSSDGVRWTTIGNGSWSAGQNPNALGGTNYSTQCDFTYFVRIIGATGSAVCLVDFTNAPIGINTTVADQVSGSWVLSSGAQIERSIPGFGAGPNVLLSSGGIFSGPTLAYTSSDTLTLTFDVLQIQPSVTSDLIGNGEWYWYIDTNTKCQGFYSVNGGGIGLTSSFPLPNGGIPRVVVSGASVAFQHSLDGGTTFVAEGTQSLGGAGLTGASAGALVTGAHLAPIVGWFTVAKNGFVAHSVDFTNAAVGTNTTVADAVSGSWVLSGGAQIVMETAPSLTMASVTIYDNSLIGAGAGAPVTSTVTGVAVLSYSGSTLLRLSGGQLVVNGSLTGMSGQTISGTLALSDGIRTTTLPISVPIIAGSELLPSKMTAVLSSSLDNSMINTVTDFTSLHLGGAANVPAWDGLCGTITIVGISNAIWAIDVQDDCVQSATYFIGGSAARYSIVSTGSSGGNSTAAIYCNSSLSAQTDILIIDAANGPAHCRNTFPLTVAEKIGPVKTVGDAGGGYDFPTWNAALDAYYQDYATYAGMKLIMHPKANKYADDFSRVQIGHGSPQQWPCGPLTLEGSGWKTDGTGTRTLIDMGGNAPADSAKGCIIQFQFDLTCRALEVANVSNAASGTTGRPNGAAFYCEAQTLGNLTLDHCYARDSNDGLLNADAGKNVKLIGWMTAYNGYGDFGYDHNTYIGHCSSYLVTKGLFGNSVSWATCFVHDFKTRGMKGIVEYLNAFDGNNGRGSSCLDISNGGNIEVRHSNFQKGCKPSGPNAFMAETDTGDDNTIQWCHEVGNQSFWPYNNMNFHDNILYDYLQPGRGSDGKGVSGCQGANPDTGLPTTAQVANNQFYGYPAANRIDWSFYAPGPSTYADGGGNVGFSTVSAPLEIIDPLTGLPPVSLPRGNYCDLLNPSFSAPNRLMAHPLCVQFTVPANAAPGATIYAIPGVAAVLTAWDAKNTHITSPAYSLHSVVSTATVSPTAVAINPSTGALTVGAGGAPADGLMWFYATCTGTNSSGATEENEARFVVLVGNGSHP